MVSNRAFLTRNTTRAFFFNAFFCSRKTSPHTYDTSQDIYPYGCRVSSSLKLFIPRAWPTFVRPGRSSFPLCIGKRSTLLALSVCTDDCLVFGFGMARMEYTSGETFCLGVRTYCPAENKPLSQLECFAAVASVPYGPAA